MIEYPPTTKVNQVDDYHGTKVADPFRWLEDLDAPETKAWTEEQNRVTFGYLNSLPRREEINRRLTELWDYEKFGGAWRSGNRYFLLQNEGLQNHFVLYTMETLEDEPRVLLDPNTWSDDGTVALTNWSVSEDGNYLAYAKSSAGSDWQEWKVVNVETGVDEPDDLRWIKFSGAAWLPDGSGFYYSRYPEPTGEMKLEDANYFQQLRFHKLGEDQSADALIYKRDDQKEWGFQPRVTEDGRYLIISVWKGTHPENNVFYIDLKQEGDVIELHKDFEAAWHFVGNEGSLMWFRTDSDAPKGRLVAVDVENADQGNWREVLPEIEEKLEFVTLVGDQFFAHYWSDAHSVVKVFDLSGNYRHDVDLPGLGTAIGFGGKRSHDETFYLYTSFNAPATVYRYDLAAGKSKPFRLSELAFDPKRFDVEQVFYPSKDGTDIPMFLVYRRGLERNGNSPTLLYGYGGFNIPMTPVFAVSTIHWIEMGGIYAQACLRGGGEYGEEWHKAGALGNKQNVFDDFVSAAEWLIQERYTSSKKLAIAGGSNGGLLVGACMTQRPDLFGAVVASRGVLDMLRFHKFTIGWAWTSDYGNPDDPGDFKVLYAYSPLHNLTDGVSYPATLITTADHDDRVVPSHSFKFAARLQEAHTGDAPVLIRIETQAGHGMGTPTAKLIEELTDTRAFLLGALEARHT